jgi:hypothetical protein
MHRSLASILVCTALGLPAAAQQTLHDLHGHAQGNRYGHSVAIVGDVDGDGFADFAVGEPGDDTAGAGAGRVEMISGASGAVLWTKHGFPGSHFGHALARVGDNDGDGLPELLIGAPDEFAESGGSAGAGGGVWLFSGKQGGFLWGVSFTEPWAQLGQAVCGLDDVDGDGVADFAVAVPRGDWFDLAGTYSDAGLVWVYRGGKSPKFLYELRGAKPYDLFGSSIASAGDIDHDGRGDLVVGAPAADFHGIDNGMAYVHSGKSGKALFARFGGWDHANMGAAVAGGRDFNLDGWPDLVLGEPHSQVSGPGSGYVLVVDGRTRKQMFALHGAPGSRLGTAVAALGDVDGDGAPDFAAGAIHMDAAWGANVGELRVLSGGLGAPLWILHGDGPDDQMGRAVAGGGDVDKDGRSDVIVGLPLEDWNGADRGGARVLAWP